MLIRWAIFLVALLSDHLVARAFMSRRHQRTGHPRATSDSDSMVVVLSLSGAASSMEPSDPQRRRPTQVSKPPVTETATPLPEADKLPVNHKIVVLGATGRVGRRVVRHLLEQSPPGTLVVALVRDYDKACRVLYDDVIGLKIQQERRAPRLQIVVADLVPRSDRPKAVNDKRHMEETEQERYDEEWRQRAQSAANFFGKQVGDFDDGRLNVTIVDEEEHALALQQVMEGCTAVVSCVGAIRTTRPWSDWWLPRLLQQDVRPWCADARHPYYTQYHITRKVLHLAEREQARRNVLYQAQDEVDRQNQQTSALTARRRDKDAPPRRIRFVRLSDLAVAQSPWALVPLFINAVCSMAVRYHALADKLLAAPSSRLLDTVIVRAGGLVDEERDEDQVSVQVVVEEYHEGDNRTTMELWDDEEQLASATWTPARVGRDDVAALLASATLAPWLSSSYERHVATKNQTNDSSTLTTEPFHYTLAVRWTGDAQVMAPYPPQGTKAQGCRTAAQSLQKAVKKTLRRRNKLSTATTTPASTTVWRNKLKPYGICVAIPLYLMLGLVLQNLVPVLFRTRWSSRIFRRIAGSLAKPSPSVLF